MANNKRSGGKTIGLKIYAVITSLLIAASAVVVGVGFGTGRWQIAPKDEPVQEQPDEEAGGAVIGEGKENGISHREPGKGKSSSPGSCDFCCIRRMDVPAHESRGNYFI